ncbi:MAG: 3-oxoacyl-[acyl-carrier-protein] synthase III C-terminal domain-containing protein [Bacteroidota bacterium]
MNLTYPKILSVAKALPSFTRTTEDSLDHIKEWIKDQPERTQKKILRLFKYAEVDRRYSIMDIDEVFQATSFEEKNSLYMQKSVELAEKALKSALKKANLRPEDLDIIITTSCTGYMIPSLDAYLINRLHMRQDIMRLPVTEMGCAAGASALIYGQNLLRHQPDKYAAVIAVESPTSNFQHEDFSMENVVSAAIFGDGCACAILGPSSEVRPAIIDTDMFHFYDTINLLGYRLSNTGFKMVLSPQLPEAIARQFQEVVNPFLDRNGIQLKDIKHFIFHPGGKKIVQAVEGILHALGKHINETREVLKDYGNISSATVLYVLDKVFEDPHETGDLGLMLGFGPGFTAQRLLLRWE